MTTKKITAASAAPGDVRLSTRQAAGHLGIKVSRLHDRWRAWGLRPYRVGRTLVWSLAELDAWLDGQRESA